MIRKLGPGDLLRLLMPGRLGGEPLAFTRDALSSSPRSLSRSELARWSAVNAGSSVALGLVDGGRLDAAVLVRVRSGPRAWEVARLFASERAEAALGDLLEACVAHVGARGGERLFLRAPNGAGVEAAAIRAGFVPAFTEEVFRRDRAMVLGTGGPSLSLRPALPADDYAIFRLHNAVLPAEVRAGGGLTFDQWLDAREQPGGTAREYLREDGDSVRGWLRLEHAGDALTVDAMLHPDDAWAADPLVDDAALLAWGHASAAWVVPSYAPALAAVLERRGLKTGQRYAVLVRPVAVRVREPAFAAVRA